MCGKMFRYWTTQLHTKKKKKKKGRNTMFDRKKDMQVLALWRTHHYV